MIKSFNQFINENDSDRKFGCLMVNFGSAGWKEEVESMIDSTDLYTEEEGHGLELEPHCTILYGFHDEDFSLDKAMKLLIPISDIEVQSDGISIFSNEKYDVVKYDIQSDKFVDLNSKFSENFKYTNKFPDYHAHCTIAYVKPGMGEKYKKAIEKTFIPKQYKYSYANEDKVYINKV